MKLIEQYLDDLQNESFAGDAGRVAGSTLRTVGKAAAKTIYGTGKFAGKTAVGFGKGFINAKKAKATNNIVKKRSRKIPNPYDVAKSYFKKPLNKMREK